MTPRNTSGSRICAGRRLHFPPQGVAWPRMPRGIGLTQMMHLRASGASARLGKNIASPASRMARPPALCACDPQCPSATSAGAEFLNSGAHECFARLQTPLCLLGGIGRLASNDCDGTCCSGPVIASAIDMIVPFLPLSVRPSWGRRLGSTDLLANDKTVALHRRRRFSLGQSPVWRSEWTKCTSYGSASLGSLSLLLWCWRH